MTSGAFSMHRSWARQARVGFLGATTPTVWSAFVEAFEHRLRELGWIDGSNIAIDYRWAEGRQDRYAQFAEDFARQEVEVIVTSGTTPTVAAKKATTSIPIVFAAAGDPVGTNLVASLARPGRNITGLSNGQTDLASERLDSLRSVVPNLQRLAIIGNRGSRNVVLEMEQVTKRARKLKIETVICDVRKATQITPEIKQLRGKADALFVCTDPFVTTNQITINIAAASVRLPTMHAFREYVEAGGLMSYGPDFRAMFQHAADFVDRILRGAKPAEIPIGLQKKTELVINQNTANTLGLRIPGRVRGRAILIR
jgi:putative ABC transport system substrate-binding protein